MAFPLPAHGLAALLTAFVMTHCQKKNHPGRKVSVGANQVERIENGISWEKQPCLSISGDSHDLYFRWQIQDNGEWQEIASVGLNRINPPDHRLPLHFPKSLRLHEQQFQEGKITYFLTTGYVVSKRLFFHRMRCDHPGALHVRATLAPEGKFDKKSLGKASPRASRLWLLPFEAEVVNTQNSLIIEGEGELLLLWHLSDDQNAATSWQSLLREYDPGSDEEELNLPKVADALQEAARSQN